MDRDCRLVNDRFVTRPAKVRFSEDELGFYKAQSDLQNDFQHQTISLAQVTARNKDYC